MKGIVILFCSLAAVLASPTYRIPEANDHQEWAFVPDGNGNFHFVDLNADLPEDEPTLRFNAPSDIIFRLFTRSNPTNPQILTLENINSLQNSHWNAAHPTRFIIHGWNNNGGSPVNNLIRTAWINRGNFNVITVDWGVGAQTANYPAARNRVGAVGGVVARMIDFLNAQGGQAFNNIAIVGHSLGGHAAGMTGKQVNRGNIHTIWALDPALPLFSVDNPGQRVHSTDAQYVEIIHTNAGLLGFDVPIGDASFYPNGGRTQPGCGVDVAGNCAHSRAWEFFAESITTGTHFVGRLCPQGWTNINNEQFGACVSNANNRRMGGDPSSNARGVFFLTTNGASPFAHG